MNLLELKKELLDRKSGIVEDILQQVREAAHAGESYVDVYGEYDQTVCGHLRQLGYRVSYTRASMLTRIEGWI